MPEVQPLMSPLLQGGFAVFSLILLGMLFWLVKRLLKVLEDNNKIIGGNTEALRDTVENGKEHRAALSAVKDQLLTRPCMLEEPNFQARLGDIIRSVARVATEKGSE